jgi:hypothetical protein
MEEEMKGTLSTLAMVALSAGAAAQPARNDKISTFDVVSYKCIDFVEDVAVSQASQFNDRTARANQAVFFSIGYIYGRLDEKEGELLFALDKLMPANSAVYQKCRNEPNLLLIEAIRSITPQLSRTVAPPAGQP